MILCIWLILTIIASCLYRCGGASKTGKWYDLLLNTKARDCGVPFIGLTLLLIIYPQYGWKVLLSYVLTFGLYFGSMTTYWKKKGTDAKWFNWVYTSLGYSFAFLPFAIASGHWLGFALRTIFVVVATTLWSEKIDNCVWEECGRGFITTATLPLLLI